MATSSPRRMTTRALGTCSTAEISPGFSNPEVSEPVIRAHPGPLGCGMIRHQCHVALVNPSQAQGHSCSPVSEAVRYGPTCQGRTPCSWGTPHTCDLLIPQRKAGCEGKLHRSVLKFHLPRYLPPCGARFPSSLFSSATRAKSSCLPPLVTRPCLWFIPRRVSHRLGTIFLWMLGWWEQAAGPTGFPDLPVCPWASGQYRL